LFRIFQLNPADGAPSFAEQAKLYYPEDMQRLKDAVEAAVSHGTPYEMELRAVRKDGATRICLGNGHAETGADKRVVFLFGSLQDITERKQAEHDLQESELRWRFAIEGAGDGLWDWNLADNTLFLSKRWKEMLRFTEDEIGTGIDEWEKRIHPEDKAQTLAAVQRYLDGKIPNYVTEYRVLCKDGSYKWILDRGTVISRGEDGKPLRMIGTYSDITERKRVEQALRASISEKEVLMREIHHRVKNNLQMMSALLELQSGYVKDEQVLGYFKDSQQRIQSIAMIHAQLYHNKNLAEIDFATYLHMLVEHLRGQYGALCQQVSIRVNATPCILPVDTAIPCGLVVTELVTNAMKHAFPGGRTGELRIILQASDNGNIVLEVADDGVGMPVEPNPESGKGFGMRVVKLMVEEQLHGKLRIESSHGTRVACEIGVPK